MTGWSSWLMPDWLEGLSRSISFGASLAWIFIIHYCVPNLTIRGTEEERATALSAKNRKCAQLTLELVLKLKGYYIKAAQTLCGAGLFPPEFDDVFAVLLDKCPPEGYDVVREIIEAEFGINMNHIFESFERHAVGAASIGQVHLATLRGGRQVAVKVQYPQVERYFRMDVRTIAWVMWLQGMSDKVKSIFATMEEQLQSEFDYTSEASVMRECAENIMPHYSEKVCIPMPVDSDHPFCSSSEAGGRAGVLSMCTPKVLTMERLDGVPIRAHTLQLMETFASVHGTTVEELKRVMRAAVHDPSELDRNPLIKRAMHMGPVSEGATLAVITAAKVRNAAAKLLRGCVGGACCHKEVPKWAQKPMSVPLNGPRLTRLLFEVHGHEIFQNGLFNSDPHAGNVIMMKDGRLGLIDYGAVMRLTVEQRISLARLLVAIADEDDDAVPAAFFASGFRSEKSDWRLALLMAHVSFNRGPWPYDMNRLAPKIGMPRDPDVVTLDQYLRGGKLDQIEDFPGHLVMLQRCCMVLSGIGMELGAGRLSAAGMFRPQAMKWLQQCGVRVADRQRKALA
eukprot:TRINITY_DN122766_c0_g1_i1.p1 TRINITY_DN122766_c0_g1~~TRINITY_DN122766_c0_g1_i1.p1  ORF type:complete len:566 (-),score=105.75 TRINITY_DN122766_c0_g1_i1:59-1756(-)